MQEHDKTRSTKIEIIIDADCDDEHCQGTIITGTIDLDTTIDILKICIEKLEGEKNGYQE